MKLLFAIVATTIALSGFADAAGFYWERRTLDCQRSQGAAPTCTLTKTRDRTNTTPARCRFENTRFGRRYVCDLECEGAVEDSVAMQHPGAPHPCVQTGLRRFFNYNTERIGRNFQLWKADECINSTVELSVWCKFLTP